MLGMANVTTKGSLVTITTNVAEVSAQLDRLGREQIPFAMAYSLTLTAKQARDEVRGSLHSLFTIRRNWIERGIISVSASKRDWPMQSAAVATRDSFMVRQILGGDKKARSGHLGVPITPASERSEATPPSKWPGRIVKRRGNGVFVATIRTGRLAGTQAVMRRGLVGEARRHLEVLWVLRQKVEVKARLPMPQMVSKVVEKNWDKNFGYALGMALASSKR